MEAVPALVTLDVWRIAPRTVPRALARLSVDRARARRTPGVRFAKLLGTGSGFGVTQADLTRWAKLTCWAAPGPDPVARSWDALSVERCRVSLRPLRSTGTWSRRQPFGAPADPTYDGPVAVLTRARLVPARAREFWRSAPPVEAALHGTPGLRWSLAVGEAPVGWQGTVSVWESAAALTSFAYDDPAHAAVVRRTRERGWYAEELFARFAVEDVEGTLEGTLDGRSLP